MGSEWRESRRAVDHAFGKGGGGGSYVRIRVFHDETPAAAIGTIS